MKMKDIMLKHALTFQSTKLKVDYCTNSTQVQVMTIYWCCGEVERVVILLPVEHTYQSQCRRVGNATQVSEDHLSIGRNPPLT